MQKDTILVTGAAGFIGSHFVEKLALKTNSLILGIDNLADYYDLKLKKHNLEILKEYVNFNFLKTDIREFNALENLFKKHKIIKIIHLAAQAGVRYSLENPFVYEETNVKGTLNLLELAKKFHIEQFVFASSSSVYGDQVKTPFSEDDPINKPISLYAATKQAGEALCYSYSDLFSLKMICLRFFTVYGPRGRPDMAPYRFTNDILNDRTIKIFDNPPCKVARDFTFITDITKGMIKVLDLENRFEIINLGNGSPVNIMDFLKSLENITAKTAKLKFVGRQPGDVLRTYADIEKAKRLLGYKPTIDIDQGMKKFVEWYKDYYA